MVSILINNRKNKMKIGIPSGHLYDRLIDNYSNMPDAGKITLLRGSDERLGEMFKNKELDIAFLSPLAYSGGVSDEEYRIIPTTCLALESYSGHLSVFFNSRARKLETLAARSETEYLTVAARIILAERYELFPEINIEDVGNREISDLLKRSDMALIPGNSDAHDNSIDISEQWFDTYEFPLLLGCWVCREYEVKKTEDAEEEAIPQKDSPEEKEYIDRMKDITERLAAHDLEAEVPILQEFKINGKEHERKGTIHYRWSRDMADVMSETLQLLFVLQIFELVPAVKVLGDDTDYFAEMQKEEAEKETTTDSSNETEHDECGDDECTCGHHHHHHHEDEDGSCGCDDENCDENEEI